MVDHVIRRAHENPLEYSETHRQMIMAGQKSQEVQLKRNCRRLPYINPLHDGRIDPFQNPYIQAHEPNIGERVDDKYNGVIPDAGERCQDLCTVMRLVKLPQGWNLVIENVHCKLREISDDGPDDKHDAGQNCMFGYRDTEGTQVIQRLYDRCAYLQPGNQLNTGIRQQGQQGWIDKQTDVVDTR